MTYFPSEFQAFSISSRLFPFVSNNFFFAYRKESRQKKENIKNVVAMPNPSLIIGNNRFTTQSETHMVMMHIDKAVPLMCVGNISVEITNFNGPREKAKNNRNKMMLNNMNHPVIFIKKQTPVSAKARAAHNEPTMYKGLRPQVSTFEIAIKVKSTLADPRMT